jgi:hypothetical protein
MTNLNNLRDDPRVTVRRGGQPDASGNCVVYWMQRAQRAARYSGRCYMSLASTGRKFDAKRYTADVEMLEQYDA